MFLSKQLNYISANILRCYISLELYLYPLKKSPPLNIAYEYIFHQLMFLESFYIHFRKLTEPKNNKERCSLDTLCNNIIDYNTSKFDNISSITNQLVKMLQDIREKEEIRKIQKIRDCFTHSIPKRLSELQVSHDHVLKIKKDLDNITDIIETIYISILEEKTSLNLYQQFAQDYAQRFWDTLTVGTATLNPDFEEYQIKLNEFTNAMKLISQSNKSAL